SFPPSGARSPAAWRGSPTARGRSLSSSSWASPMTRPDGPCNSSIEPIRFAHRITSSTSGREGGGSAPPASAARARPGTAASVAWARATAAWARWVASRAGALRASGHAGPRASPVGRVGARGEGSAHLLEHARGGDRLLAPARRGEPGQVLAEVDAFAHLLLE